MCATDLRYPCDSARFEPLLATLRPQCKLESFRAGSLISANTTDFEEFCELAAGWKMDHQLIGYGKPSVKCSGVLTRSFQVVLVEHAAGYSSQGETPKETVSFLVPLDPQRRLIHRGKGVDQFEMGVTRSGSGFELLNHSGSYHLVVSAHEATLEQYCYDIGGDAFSLGHSPNRVRFRDMARRSQYLDACWSILDDAQKQPELLGKPGVVARLQDRLLENLLLRTEGNAGYVDVPSRFQVARKAYHYLQEHLEVVPSIRDLCTFTRASYATLERSFRETYGSTPHAYLRSVRLSRARKDLRQPSPETTVTGVALRWGFFELGRFSVQYRQRFAETPSETLRKARASLGLLPSMGIASARA